MSSFSYTKSPTKFQEIFSWYIECPKMKLYTFLLIPTKKVDYHNIKHISIKIKKVKTGLEISDFRTVLGITHAIVIIGQWTM